MIKDADLGIFNNNYNRRRFDHLFIIRSKSSYK